MAVSLTDKALQHGRPVLTGRGSGFLVLCLLAIIGGAMAQSSAVVQIGLFGLLVLLIARVAAKWNLNGIVCHRRTPERVYAGDDMEMKLQVENRKRVLDSFAIEIEDSLLPFASKGMTATWVRAGSVCHQAFSTRLVKRGLIEHSAISIRSTFPFGLYRMHRKQRVPVSITVFPRPVIPRAFQHAADSDMLEGDNEGLLTHDWSGDFRSIRPFRPGDPLKAIHWSATARSRDLMVRELDKPVPEKYSIVFHSYCPPQGLIWPETFESSMELLAGLLVHCQRKEVPLDLTASFNRWKSVTVSDPHDLSEPMSLLAQAEHMPENNLDRLVRTLRELPGDHAVFVLSNTPVKLWADLLPILPRQITCLDNSDIRIKRPVFRLE